MSLNLNKSVSLYYFAFIFIMSFTWMLPFMPVWAYTPEFISPSIYIAFALQQLFLFSALIFIDMYFSRKIVTFITASIALVYTGFTLFDAFIMNITSISLYESIITLATGGSFLKTLEEIGLSTGFLIILFSIIVFVFSIGGIVNLFIPRVSLNLKQQKIIQIVFIAITVIYFAEHFFMHNDLSYHARREIPFYCKVFPTGSETLTIDVPERYSKKKINEYLETISSARNPKHVLYILLESFRKDMINPKNAPNMYRLRAEGLSFPQSYAAGTYTPISFNTIFFDMPAYTFLRDVKAFTKESSGALPFKIMQRAGYKTHLITSANFEWKNFRNRINGSNNAIDYFYSPFTLDMATKRHLLDYKVLNKVKEVFSTKTKKSKFVMIQLDSSHWTYFFGKEAEMKKNYPPQNINIAKLSNQDDIDEIYKRYVNSVKQVDIIFGKMVAHLKKNGLYDDTAIIIAGDHGEGFKVRMLGHSVLHKDVTTVPIIMHLPGVKSRVMKTRISHKNILPTLYEYLKIPGIKDSMALGRSVLDNPVNNKGILIIHSSTFQAELNYPDYMIHFVLNIEPETITFTPYRYLTIERKPVKDKKTIDMLRKRWQHDLPVIIRKK